MPEQTYTDDATNGGYVLLYAVPAIVLFALGFLVGMIV